MTRTAATLFSGGEGGGIGMQAASYTHVFGIEKDPAIADVARANGFHVLTADVCAIDYASLPRVDWLHASPPCINASQAKADAGETPIDGELAAAVCRAIATLLPPCFSLENVWGYRTFDAFASILESLSACGYSYEYWHLNAASYGVPQTRKRLILVAKRGVWRIQRPEPTHTKGGDMWLPPWIGWYEAIEDLLPTLPESRFAPWQLARLPQDVSGSFYTIAQQSDDKAGSEFGYGCPRRPLHDPAFTVTATQSPGWYKAFLMGKGADKFGDGIQYADEPACTVVAQSNNRYRAFLMRSGNTQQEGNQTRHADEPNMCITAAERPRAFLVGGANTSEGQCAPGVGVSEQDEPTRCVNASNSQHWRAFLVEGDSGGPRPIMTRNQDDPALALMTNAGTGTRAWLGEGRIVSMSARALARFQSFPDTYVLPDRTSLACKIIGNACCPLLFQRIGESL